MKRDQKVARGRRAWPTRLAAPRLAHAVSEGSARRARERVLRQRCDRECTWERRARSQFLAETTVRSLSSGGRLVCDFSRLCGGVSGVSRALPGHRGAQLRGRFPSPPRLILGGMRLVLPGCGAGLPDGAADGAGVGGAFARRFAVMSASARSAAAVASGAALAEASACRVASTTV